MEIGRWLMLFGALLLAVGALFYLGGRWLHLGRLPGDFVWQHGSFTLYAPLASSLLLSLLLTLLLNLFLGRR